MERYPSRPATSDVNVRTSSKWRERAGRDDDHGRLLREEFYVSAEDAGDFLVELGEQLGDGDRIAVTGGDWELPFDFGEPVEIGIEFEGGGEPELELEVELKGRVEGEAPDAS